MGRNVFQPNFTADTGDHGDTGLNIRGRIRTIQWNPTTGDTGAGLTIAVNPRRADTGSATVVYTAPAAAMGADFRVTDTGALSNIHLQNENLRIKYLNSTTLAGTLYVTHENE